VQTRDKEIDDPIVISQTKTFNCCNFFKSLLDNYSSRTTIQGINYVADKSRPWIEKIWWIFVILFSVFCCGSLIFDVYERYDQSPIIVSFSNEETPISQVRSNCTPPLLKHISFP
jgi:hypothetical protein